MPLLNNPWLIGIIGGAIAGVLGGLVLMYFREYKTRQITKTDLMSRVNNVDELLNSGLVDDALLKYEEVLRKVSEAKYPDIYARIMNSQGMCYFGWARVRDKKENLTKAIRACEETLRIYTVERYPLYHEEVASNMRKAQRELQLGT